MNVDGLERFLISSPTYDPSWSVPQADYHLLAQRKTRYCVVIPVINENGKFQKQLCAMQELGIPERADILIADGGSNDGSTDLTFLLSVGVRALLVKRDSGKLGAQLRIGYAFAMTEGYEGVITIDGNGKDSVESVPLFLEALGRGVDYAQGSRFIPGGQAVNTPPSRLLAIHLLYAPLVSLAARFRLTDTTNGFRAYSRRYLLHPQVQPFRQIFQTYGLLAYLSARASRLGLRVNEIPVARRYPATGPIPTKITPFRGNLHMLHILFRLLTGQYDPPA